MKRMRVSGIECVRLATQLLQRLHAADHTAGVWGTADLQWWWRRPRSSDAIEQLFLVDEEGPVATALLTDWVDWWQIDPIVLFDDALPIVWSDALAKVPATKVEVLVRDDDSALLSVLESSGFERHPDAGGITWTTAGELPPLRELPSGYTLTDRSMTASGPHWLEARNGRDVEPRLRETQLYDPALDLAVHTSDGDLAAYALFWLDPVTSIGMLEPMRTEDHHQRRGVGRALVSSGMHRLVDRGAEHLKVGYATEAAKSLYVDAGGVPLHASMLMYRRSA